MFERELSRAVDEIERKKLKNKARTRNLARRGKFGGGALSRTTDCSQCLRRMSKYTADEQIKNKREFAPICVACILGKPRTDHPKRCDPFPHYKIKK